MRACVLGGLQICSRAPGRRPADSQRRLEREKRKTSGEVGADAQRRGHTPRAIIYSSRELFRRQTAAAWGGCSGLSFGEHPSRARERPHTAIKMYLHLKRGADNL